MEESQTAIIQGGIILILLMGSAFFSASETALMSVNRVKLKQFREKNPKGVAVLEKLLSNVSSLLSSLLFGNNVVNIFISSLVTSLAISLKVKSLTLVTLGITMVILIFGEIVPKTLARSNPEKFSLRVVYPMKVITIILTPLNFLLSKISAFFVYLTGGELESYSKVTEKQIREIIEVGQEEGALEEEEKKMIYNVFEFGDTHVKDVMIPRTDTIAINTNMTFSEIMNIFKSERYSRLPVYEDSIDNIVGILKVKDLLLKDVDETNFELKSMINQAMLTYEYINVSDLFNEMRAKREGMAIVINEYGGVEGIITMEDIIEEIVGDIEDEYDEKEEKVIKLTENEYLIDADAKIEDFSDDFDSEFVKYHEDDDVLSETFGGLLMERCGSIPNIDEEIDLDNYKIKIVSVDKHKIEKIRLIKNT